MAGADPTRSALLEGGVGVLVALIVLVVTGLVTAEADRREALRQDQRAAFVDLIASANDCQRADAALVEYQAFPPAPGEPVDLKELIRTTAQIRADCVIPLESHAAAVRLLVGESDLSDAVDQVVDATTGLLKPPDQVFVVPRDSTVAVVPGPPQGPPPLAEPPQDSGATAFLTAMTRFERLAAGYVSRPAISPVLSFIGGTVGAVILGIGAFLLVRARRSALARSGAPSVS